MSDINEFKKDATVTPRKDAIDSPKNETQQSSRDQFTRGTSPSNPIDYRSENVNDLVDPTGTNEAFMAQATLSSPARGLGITSLSLGIFSLVVYFLGLCLPGIGSFIALCISVPGWILSSIGKRRLQAYTTLIHQSASEQKLSVETYNQFSRDNLYLRSAKILNVAATALSLLTLILISVLVVLGIIFFPVILDWLGSFFEWTFDQLQMQV